MFIKVVKETVFNCFLFTKMCIHLFKMNEMEFYGHAGKKNPVLLNVCYLNVIYQDNEKHFIMANFYIHILTLTFKYTLIC